jgi:photosystem II stability/assembly factor-like uncharacterized protein
MTVKIPGEPRHHLLHLPGHPTWHGAIRPLFTDGDIHCMKRMRGLDLGDYQSVKIMARMIYEQVARGTMPPGRPWSLEQVTCFKRWMDAGCPLGEEPPERLPRWYPTGAPRTSACYDDLCFLDPLVGWAINANGQILHTRDGGGAWIQQFQTPVIDDRPIYLQAIAFATPDKGWVGTLCSTHRLYHTGDGGHQWRVVTRLPSEAPTQISSLSIVGEHTVYAAGTPDPRQPPRMMRTVDGGRHWTAWDMSPHASTLLDVHFFNVTHGLAVGGQSDRTRPHRTDLKPIILHTSDGGRTWDNRIADLPAPTGGAWGSKIFFLDERVGFVTLAGRHAGVILKTRDGGWNWERLPAQCPHGGDLHGIGFIDETLGWVGTWGDAHDPGGPSGETRDGGRTFTAAPHIGQLIRRFRFLDTPTSISPPIDNAAGPTVGAPVGYAVGVTVYKYSTVPSEEIGAVPPHAISSIPIRLRDHTPGHFRGSVPIGYALPAGTRRVWLHIWDQFGSLVRTLVAEKSPTEGEHTLHWDGTDDRRQPIAPGVFVYRLTVDDVAESRIIRFTR